MFIGCYKHITLSGLSSLTIYLNINTLWCIGKAETNLTNSMRLRPFIVFTHVPKQMLQHLTSFNIIAFVKLYYSDVVLWPTSSTNLSIFVFSYVMATHPNTWTRTDSIEYNDIPINLLHFFWVRNKSVCWKRKCKYSFGTHLIRLKK